MCTGNWVAFTIRERWGRFLWCVGSNKHRGQPKKVIRIRIDNFGGLEGWEFFGNIIIGGSALHINYLCSLTAGR